MFEPQEHLSLTLTPLWLLFFLPVVPTPATRAAPPPHPLPLLPSHLSLPSFPIPSPPTPPPPPLQTHLKSIQALSEKEEIQSTSHAAPAGRKEAFVIALALSLSLFLLPASLIFLQLCFFLHTDSQTHRSDFFFPSFHFLSFPSQCIVFRVRRVPPPPSRRMVHLSLSAFSAKQFFIICTAGVNSAEKERTQSRNKTRRHHHRNTHANIVSSASFLCPALILLVVRESKADMVSEL